MSIEAMKQALEALEEFADHYEDCQQYPTFTRPDLEPPCDCGYEQAITSLRQAIEQAQPCPYIRSTREGTHHCTLSQRPWVGLTDAEIEEFDYYARDLVMDIEKALKEKNNVA